MVSNTLSLLCPFGLLLLNQHNRVNNLTPSVSSNTALTLGDKGATEKGFHTMGSYRSRDRKFGGWGMGRGELGMGDGGGVRATVRLSKAFRCHVCKGFCRFS